MGFMYTGMSAVYPLLNDVMSAILQTAGSDPTHGRRGQ